MADKTTPAAKDKASPNGATGPQEASGATGTAGPQAAAPPDRGVHLDVASPVPRLVSVNVIVVVNGAKPGSRVEIKLEQESGPTQTIPTTARSNGHADGEFKVVFAAAGVFIMTASAGDDLGPIGSDSKAVEVLP
jgi:hypothetical protein